MNHRKNEAHMSDDARLAILETTILNINSSLLDIKHDIRRLDEKIDGLQNSLQNRLWSNFLWLMGMMIGLAGLIAHTQHWL